MRVVILLAAIVLVLALVGWITFRKGPEGPSVTVESERIRQDTKRVMDSGAQVLHKAGDKVEQTAKDRSDSQPTNREVTPATR
jgi:hypothetical protein